MELSMPWSNSMCLWLFLAEIESGSSEKNPHISTSGQRRHLRCNSGARWSGRFRVVASWEGLTKRGRAPQCILSVPRGPKGDGIALLGRGILLLPGTVKSREGGLCRRTMANHGSKCWDEAPDATVPSQPCLTCPSIPSCPLARLESK